MLRAVIFDFDGVITDSEILHFRTFNKVLADYGIVITKKSYYKNYLGLSDFDLFSLFVKKGRLKLKDKTIEDLIRQKNLLFEKLAKTEGKIIKGVRQFLEMLKKDNIALAIYSGALRTEIELVLEQAGLRDYFDVIISAEQVKKGKPHPEGFLLALEKLNQNTTETIGSNQCVVIEDTHWGIEAAKAAGMHTIAVTNSYDAEQLACAEKVIEHLNQLTITSLQKVCD